MDEQGKTQGQQQNPIQVWADRLAFESAAHLQTAIEVGQFDAEQLKVGLVRLLEVRAELLQSLRDGLVTQQDSSLLLLGQLASSGSIIHLNALRELMSIARSLGAVQVPPQPKVTLA